MKLDWTLELEHGKPLVFGHQRNKGIRLKGLEPEVVTLGEGATEADLLVHDEKALQPSLAYLLSRMHYPAFPEPLGVFRCVDRPIYDQRLTDQLDEAQKAQGPGDLQKLFSSGETWTVG
jgi:2-oxoglutarate ferredoxin oxidoreductase subunit beta